MTALKIFIACAMGAAIGSFASLEINSSFWWVGMIIGGLVGYIAYEFKQVIQSIPRAWSITKSELPKIIHSCLNFFTADRMRFMVKYACLNINFFIALTICFLFGLTLLSPILVDPDFYKHLIQACALTASMVTMLLGCVPIYEIVTDSVTFKPITNKCLFNPFYFWLWHIPFVFFPCIVRKYRNCMIILAQLLFEGLKAIVTHTPLCLHWCAKFIATIFVLIHSELRLLCAVDAAIGAAIGYFAGNVLIGALAGGVFGVVNYAVISKKLLKEKANV